MSNDIKDKDMKISPISIDSIRAVNHKMVKGVAIPVAFQVNGASMQCSTPFGKKNVYISKDTLAKGIVETMKSNKLVIKGATKCVVASSKGMKGIK